MNFIYNINIILLLFREAVTRNYQSLNVTINLSFAMANIIKKLIFCKIIHEIENLFDYLLIITIFNWRTPKKSKRRFKYNYKIINVKKFIKIIKKQLSKFLFNRSITCQCINNFTTKLLQIFKMIAKRFTS